MKNERITPTGHHVLIDVEKVEEVSKGGIFIPKSLTDREQGGACRGVIVAAGPDAWHDKPTMWAREGDHVIMAKYAGFAIDDTTRLVNDEDIIAVVYPGQEVLP